jgi:hypothetical protein
MSRRAAASLVMGTVRVQRVRVGEAKRALPGEHKRDPREDPFHGIGFHRLTCD